MLNRLVPALFNRVYIHPAKKEALTAVYVLGCRKTGAVKVGIALDVMERLAALQTGFPHKLALYSANYTSRVWAERLERMCHAKLTEFGFHLHGEWFDAEPDDVTALIAKLAAKADIPTLTCGEYFGMVGTWEDILHNNGRELNAARRRIQLDSVLGR